MAQAKTLTKEEMTRVLDYINTRRFAQRNRAMMLLTHLAGLRIGEVACLRWSDVMNLDGTIKDEIRLLPDMTKGRHARTVFVNIKLREELQAYAEQAKCVERSYLFLQAKKALRQGLVQTAWPKRSPSSMKALDLKELAVTAVAERS